jgi:hypothetical protein
MSNTAYSKARAEGYEYTGITLETWKDREIIEARAKELRVMGNKVRIVIKTDVTHFRNSTSKNSYWVVMVKYSEAWLKDQSEKREAERQARRKMELVGIAKTLTREEAMFILGEVYARENVEVTDGQPQ